MTERTSRVFESFLSDNCPPMGICETLYAFRDSFGSFMGTKELIHGLKDSPNYSSRDVRWPPLPDSVEVTWEDRFYPKAWGHPELRESITEYYNNRYGSKITPNNVMIFAGGRPGIYTVMAFLKERVKVRIGNIEWPAYLDIMEQTRTTFKLYRLQRKIVFIHLIQVILIGQISTQRPF